MRQRTSNVTGQRTSTVTGQITSMVTGQWTSTVTGQRTSNVRGQTIKGHITSLTKFLCVVPCVVLCNVIN